METKNLGVLPPKIELSDYIAGAETGIVYKEINPTGDWGMFLPTKESQYITSFDSSACVTFSALNCIETQLNFLMATLDPDKLQKLKDWGYITDGKFNFSDRYTAKMSGTTSQGNSLQKVWDSIRRDGLVPEAMWATTTTGGWAEYYKEIPQQVKDFAKNILTIFDFKYEWIVTSNCEAPNIPYLKYHLKQAPLQPAHPVGGKDSGGIYQRLNVCATAHATTIYNIDDFIKNFDHYYPYNNVYALDREFPWIMKGIVTLKENEDEEPAFNHEFKKDLKYGDKGSEVIYLQQALNILGYNIPISPDNGYFSKTTAAVLDLWKKNGIASQWEITTLKGRNVGPKTRAWLNKKLLNK